MKATIHHSSGDYSIDFKKPIDISIHTDESSACAKAWYVDPVTIEPVLTEQFTGSVKAGGTVNFRNIFFNPHGNTTHTECVGHIADEVYNLQEHLTTYLFKAQVITIVPANYQDEESDWRKKGDLILMLEQFQGLIDKDAEAIIIRTSPNNDTKKTKQWSSSNWPFMDKQAASYLAEIGIKHLLIDLPSIDREFDGGKMLSHRAFWSYPEKTRFDATITEMIYVKNEIEDGLYFLNLQPASFVNDASPCKPVIYAAQEIK
jgi:kynurenine formamidase